MTSRQRGLFLICALITGFCISMEYGVTRPVSHALFLSLFSAKAVPWAWLAMIPLNLTVVSLYTRFLPRIGPLSMMWIISTLIVMMNLSSTFLLHSMPEWLFVQFIWKDIYILLMFKQLWSMIHTTIDAHRAKYLYGLFFGFGAVGAIIGNQIPAHYSLVWGAETLFLFTLPLYLIVAISYSCAYRSSNIQKNAFNSSPEEPFRKSWEILRSSVYLRSILILVICMQMVSALFEYQFNWHLERSIQDKDLLSSYCGQLMSLINFMNGSLQLIGVFLIVRILGLRNAHLLVPSILWGLALSLGCFSYFTTAAIAFVAVKSMDYSLFGVLRELLYPTLKTDEKFCAKAWIDVFAHRTSKSLTSFFILALQGVAGIYLLPIITSVALLLCSVWIFTVIFMFKKRNELLKTADAL